MLREFLLHITTPVYYLHLQISFNRVKHYLVKEALQLPLMDSSGKMSMKFSNQKRKNAKMFEYQL